MYTMTIRNESTDDVPRRTGEKRVPITDTVSRRSLLRKGTATGAFVVIGTTVSSPAAAGHGRIGGNMFSFEEPVVGGEFEIVGTGVPVNLPASCQAVGSNLKDYTQLVIEYAEDGTQGMVIRDERLEHLDTDGDTSYVFTSNQECKDFPGGWRGSFRPL